MSTINTFKNVTESGVIKSGNGTLVGILLNSHTSGTLALIDGLEGAVAADADLTSSGALVAGDHGQSKLTSAGAMVEATHAVSVMTGNAIVGGNIVTIDTTVYTFVAEGTQVDEANDVSVGATLTITLLNLLNAINGNVSEGGFNASTAAHAKVRAVASNATTVTVRSRTMGTGNNGIATTGTATRISWADTTLGGGTGASDAGITVDNAKIVIGAITYTVVDALSESYGSASVAYQVKKGANEASMLDNLKAAVNATGTDGTEYSTGTLVHQFIIATGNTNTVQTFLSRTVGTAAEVAVVNTLVTTETMANTSWADTTFGGGTGDSNPVVTTDASLITINGRTYSAVIQLSETSGADAVKDQVYWVTSEAVFLDNFKLAINASGVAGTQYSTGTLQNIDVVATTNTNTVQTIRARIAGTGGNAITTVETVANLAWDAAVMANGTGSNGRVICSTITLSSVGTTGERFIPFYNTQFLTGLYLTVGGTADVTLIIN